MRPHEINFQARSYKKTIQSINGTLNLGGVSEDGLSLTEFLGEVDLPTA